ncbi:MAG: cytochrome b/b6 domain-containing protein [Acidimicrobiales bacterium]
MSLQARPGTDQPAPRPRTTLERFDKVERAVHWTTAVLMLELIATGAILYIPSIALVVGHRGIVENIHVYSGLALLLPLIVGVAGPWRERLVRDLRRFDRWTAADWDWFHPKRRPRAPLGKFNGGQKAEAAFVGGGMVVMLATGVLMRFAPPSWINWQQGANLVHDIGFIAIAIGVVGHIYIALNSPEQLKSMLTGRISRSWAAKRTPIWVKEADEGKP